MSDANHKSHSEEGIPVAVRRVGTARSDFGQDLLTQTETDGEPFGDPDAPRVNDPNFTGIGQLPRDVGWLLFGVGFVGVVAPGVFGLPFLVGGGMILWPKTGKRLFELFDGGPSGPRNAGIRQVYRFLDDLEKRYPRK